MSQGPIFIVGMNGSGTTMLADSLGKHPDLYVLRLESKVLPYFIQNLKRYGDLTRIEARRRLAADLGRTKAFWQVNGKQPLVVSDSQLTSPSFAGVVGALFEELASREGKVRWGEKSPMNLAHISSLSAMFPTARFVHIVRDGRESAQSFHRRYGYEPAHTIYRWKKLVSIARRQGSLLGESRYIEILYEKLTNDPLVEMRRLCEFVDLPFNDVVLQSSLRMVDSSVAKDRKYIFENSDKWRTYFSADQIVTLEGIAGKCLHELGYSVDNRGDANPTLLRRRWWDLRDRLIGSIMFFRKWGWRSLPMFWRSLRVAAMQARTRADL